MLEDQSTKRTAKPLPVWFSLALLICLVLIVVGFLIFTAVNRKRVVGVYLQKATVLKSHDQYGAAIESLDKALLLDPQNLQIQTEQLTTKIFKLTRKFDPLNRLLNLDELDKAEADCKSLLEANPQSTELTALLGIIYAHKDRPALAIETYKKASEMNPAYANVRNYWGYSMVEWQYPDNWKALAIQKFNQAKEVDPTYVNPRINLALLSLRSGKLEDAINQLAEAEKISKNNEILYVLWGSALSTQGSQAESTDKISAYEKFSDALEKYRIAAAMNPDLLAVHINRAEILAELGSYDVAIDEFNRAITLEPSFVMAHRDLAQTLLKRNQPSDSEEALKHLKQAIESTDQVIQQYQERKTRTPDEHAQKILDQWTSDRLKEKAALEKAVQKAMKKSPANQHQSSR
jgi:tetratricopeptide (TPR) repeat protein